MPTREAAFGLSLLLLTVALIALGGRTLDSSSLEAPDAFAVVTAAHLGEGRLDREIRSWQERARSDPRPGPALERLGWAFVGKAHRSGDSGFYRLAEQTALAMEGRGAGGPSSWLLRGHALHNLHRFEEADAIARRLVAERGLAFDHGLLGDVQFDRGAIAEAADSYQRMMDLRPDAQAYARAAQLRFVTGDPEGALRAMDMAARAASPRSPESFAWMWSKLSQLQLQQGAFAQAHQSSEVALRGDPDSSVALLTRGRLLLAEDRSIEAVEPLSRAAESIPQPEVLWALSEALREGARELEAQDVETRIYALGATLDPRGFALYLATVGREEETALALAERELSARRDIYTFEALAWAQVAVGRLEEARDNIERALSHGTADARLYYHAGVIASKGGSQTEAAAWFAKAAALRHMLLPSQRRDLDAHIADLGRRGVSS